MSFAIAKLRQSASALLVVLAALLVAAPSFTFAQGQSEVGGESRDFRSRKTGRWVDLTTWQVYRSGVWINSDVAVGIPNAATNVFIETNHTIIATRANVGNTISYNGSQAWAFLEVNDLHINTAASVTTTWGSVPGGFNAVDWYNGDRFGGRVSVRPSTVVNPIRQNIIGDQDTYMAPNSTLINGGALNIAPVSAINLEPAGGNVPTPRNMELRVYGKLRYYAGAAGDRTDRDANIQVTAATIGTGSTIVFRGRTRNITVPTEWSTTLATATGYFDNTAFVGGATGPVPGVGAAINGERSPNFRGLMGRNSFWTAIFDLGRVVDRNFTSELFTGPADDPSTAVGTLQGSFTAGIIQVRRGTLRFEGEALLANEGAMTSGSIQIMNNAILQMSGNGNIGRTAVPLVSFANRFGQVFNAPWGYNSGEVVPDPDGAGPLGTMIAPAFPMTPVGFEYAVTSRMRYFVVEEGGALDFQGVVGTLSAADVRFNGTVIYSRTGNQNLVENSPFLSFNPTGPVLNTITGAAAPTAAITVNGGENGLFDPFNNNFHSVYVAVAANVQPGDPVPGTVEVYGTSPAGLGVGTAALWQPSTTAAYSHLVFRGSGTKFLPVTTVTISRALIFQGDARTGVRLASYPTGVDLTPAGNNTVVAGIPYYMQRPFGGELSAGANRIAEANDQIFTKAGFFPALAYLRGTGLTGLRQENNIGTTLNGAMDPATGLNNFGAFSANFDDVNSASIAQPMWSVYGGNTDPVAFVGFTTASTRPFFTVGGAVTTRWQDEMYGMYPEGDAYPIGMVLSASINREQLDMSPWNKPAVVHGLPAEPSYFQVGGAQAQYGHGARAVWYTGSYVTQTVGSQFDGVIRQTLDRVNGTGGANGTLQAPVATGLNPLGTAINAGNFVPGFPVITNSLYDYTINTTATTTLEYDSESSDIMSMVEFPAGAIAPHNLVMNCASNVIQVLPIRTADYRKHTDIGFQYTAGNFVSYYDFRGKTATLYGATGATTIVGPEYVNSTNANLARNAFSPVTGLYQASAIYNQNFVGAQITPGVGASAYIDTRPDVVNPRNLLANDMYTSGSGLRPGVALTGTFDGRVRAAFPQFRVTGPTFGGASNTSYPTTPVNDFGRRGDFNNFGLVELRRGTLRIPSQQITAGINEPATGLPGTFNYTFTLSSTAIVSNDQANVTYGTASSAQSTRVGVNNAAAQVLLSEATLGAEQYPSFTNWASTGIRNASVAGISAPAVVRGPAGPANLAGTLVGGDLANIVFTGGTGGTISGNALATARTAGSYVGGSSNYPASYGATDNVNSGNTELSAVLGILGVQAVAPSFNAVSPFLASAAPLAGSTNRYNAGPEMTNDADQSLVTVSYVDGFSARVGTATIPFSGNNQVYPAQTGFTYSPAANTSSSYNSGIVRANNAWNVDLPRVVGGLQHLTWLRATTNVLTLVGNSENGTTPGTPDASGLTTLAPESAGLQIYGTIATARGDIDLNARNIELGGNRSVLVETYERTPYVGIPSATAGAMPDSASGSPLWNAMQVSEPRLYNGASGFVNNGFGGGRTGDPTPVYPSRPSTVINNHRSVRAYIGLTSWRNVAAMNQGLGIEQTNEEPGGLGAQIYQTGNPVQFRVRRWQTRGVGLNGALTTRPNVRTTDRYWQIETTGTLTTPMGRSELRLQYVDTDLLNENGTTPGLAPAALNIFRAQGLPYQNPNSAFLGPFQALFAQTLVGPNSYNFVKQLTLLGSIQTVNGNVVLNTGNYASGDPAAGLSPDRTNPDPNRGFQIWAIGVPAPVCLVIRGQRFGGSFGDPIGAGSGYNVGAGGDIPQFPNNVGSTQFGGGISPATANNYGPIIGPFKAGVPTVATIIGELLDEFGFVATTNFSTGASLVIGNLDATQSVPRLAVGANPSTLGASGENAASNAYGVVAGASGLTTNAGSGAVVGGRFEWTGVRLDGVASTTITMSLRNDFVGGPYGSLDNAIVAANGGSRANPLPNAASSITFCSPGTPVQVSLQGGFPFGVTFATQNSNASGAASIVPGAQGPVAAPGRVGAITVGTPTVCSATGGYDGSLADIIVGQTVAFPYSDPGYSSIAVIVRDRFDNLASFPTQATISLGGATIDQTRTPTIGDVATSVVTWGLGKFGREVSGTPSLATPGIARTVADLAGTGSVPTGLPPFSATGNNQAANNNAARVSPVVGATGVGYPPTNNPQIFNNVATFPNFQVWGATAANVTLAVRVSNGDPYIPGPTAGTPGIPVGSASPKITSAIVCLRPGQAVGIAPVLIPDIYNRNLPNRMPSRMYIGRSNAGDPRTWFYVQAVDEFGNRVDNGPSAGGNGNVATITFARSDAGLPRSQGAGAALDFTPPGFFQFTASNDPYVKVNNQNYSAVARPGSTTSRPSVNGLYVFNDFEPIGPQSLDPLGNDVVLTFEDTNLKGIKAPRSTGVALPLFQPIPPITTATTTFLPVPRVGLVIPDAGQDGGPSNGATRVAANILLLRERRHTMQGADNGFQSGSVRVERPTTAMANDIAVAYTLDYYNVDSTLRVLPPTISGVPATLPSTNPAFARTFVLPNVGTTTLQLPAPINATPVPVFTPALPAATPVVINGLQGDLSPTTSPRNTGMSAVPVTVQSSNPLLPGTFFLDAGTASQLVNFRARWSDQVWPRTPGYQGLRAAVIALRDPDSQNATIYQVDRTAGRDTAYVLLQDPQPTPPYLINAIQDKILQRPRGTTPTEDRIELESPKWREDGIPGFVFYDDNYDPMTYSATSADATQVSVRVEQQDPRFQGRPSLYYAVQPNADTTRAINITLRAFDGIATGQDLRFAVDDFNVYIRGSVTNVANASEIAMTVSPNPAVEYVTVQATAKQTGSVRIVVTNALGQAMTSQDFSVVAGTTYRRDIKVADYANGTYFVNVIEGGRTFTQKVNKF